MKLTIFYNVINSIDDTNIKKILIWLERRFSGRGAIGEGEGGQAKHLPFVSKSSRGQPLDTTGKWSAGVWWQDKRGGKKQKKKKTRHFFA